MKSVKQSRIDKVKALATRGVDGEKANAKEILKRLEQVKPNEKPIIVEGWTALKPNGNWKEFTFEQMPGKVDIYLPYKDFVFIKGDTPAAIKTWQDICTMARVIIETETSSVTVQNWEDRITCRYYSAYCYDLQEMVAGAIYNYLINIGTPVIHAGGDKAGFAPLDDSMEDGTENSIFQFQSCQQYEAPNREAEILSAMKLPQYNKFVAVTKTGRIWGKITDYGRKDNYVTITPLNSSYAPETLHLSDIVRLYRVVSWKGVWQCTDNEAALKAAQERAAKVYGPKE